MSWLSPDLIVEHVLQLDHNRLQSLGVSGALLDVDGTLKEHYATEIAPEIAAWVADLRSAGMLMGFLSNGRSKRIGPLAKVIGVPVFAGALKPLPFACRRAVASFGLKPQQMALVGDQLFTDVLCGRLAGMRTVFVTSMSTHEPFMTSVKRPIERLLLARARRLAAGLPVTDLPVGKTPHPDA